MRLLSVAAASFAALVAAAVTTNAATLTETIDFNISFSRGPVNSWSGSFTITFDPTGQSFGTLDAFSSTLPASYGSFVYIVDSGNLLIGDNCGLLSCSAVAGHDNADLIFAVDASGIAVAAVFANLTSTSSLSEIFRGQGTAIATTPIPAALPLFATGLGVIGLLGWRRKRKAAAQTAA